MTARRRRRLIVTGSVALHAAVLAAFVISGMWKIERIDAAPNDTLNLSVVSEAALAGGSPHPKATADITPKPRTPPKVVVDHIVVPVVSAPTETTTSTSDRDDIDGPPSDVVGPPGDGGKCKQPPCGEDRNAEPKPVAVVEPPKTVRVTPIEISALRLSGETNIHPPDTDKTTMLRDGKRQAMGIFEICISATGSIDSVKKLRSTKYDGYDSRIESTMRTWRYRPYQAKDGAFTRACSTVTFSYTMQ